MSSRTIYFGTFVHNASLKELAVLSDGMVGVDSQGIIRFIDQGAAVQNYRSAGKNDGLSEIAREWIRGVQGRGTILNFHGSQEGAVAFWYPGFVGKREIPFIYCTYFSGSPLEKHHN